MLISLLPIDVIRYITSYLTNAHEIVSLATALSVRIQYILSQPCEQHLLNELVMYSIFHRKSESLQMVLRHKLHLNDEEAQQLIQIFWYGKPPKHDFISWCRNNGSPWNEDTIYCAARNGTLLMVKWLRQEGCMWDKDKMSVAATIGGNLDILKFVLNEGCPWDPYAVFIARRNNKPEILQFTAKHWSFIN